MDRSPDHEVVKVSSPEVLEVKKRLLKGTSLGLGQVVGNGRHRGCHLSTGSNSRTDAFGKGLSNHVIVIDGFMLSKHAKLI